MKTWTRAELQNLPTAELITLMGDAARDLSECDLGARQSLLDLLEDIRTVLAERRAVRLLGSLTP